ncbi:MAG: malonyl-CoA synthase [Spongiibacteraceae bacterium]
MTNIYSAIKNSFPQDRNRPFAIRPDGTEFSYADLDARSAAFANVLVAKGVGVGDRVAVQADKCIDMLMLYLGCARAGAIFLPLNPAYTAHELEYFIKDAEPALFVCATSKRAAIEQLATAAGVKNVADLSDDGTGSLSRSADAASSEFATIARDEDDIAAILYTSGTTGRAKGAMLSHGNLLSNALTLKDFWRFTRDDVLLHALPIFHTHGLFVATNVTLLAGASMIFLPQFDVAQVMHLLPRATVMMGVPTFYIRMLGEAGLTEVSVENIRLFISGSAPLSADIHREFKQRTGHAILERYGMTETNMITSNPYEGERVAGTVGFPLPGISVRIADTGNGDVLPQGSVGVIEVKGPNVFKGYWRMPEKTAAEFHDGYFITGDLGFIDERGYLAIVGRAKDLIISGGYNIYPAEVEAALDELPMVRESAVIGAPHPDMGEGVVAVIVPREPAFSDTHLIAEAMSTRLARFKQPRRIVVISELPKNSMGKIQKTVLRETYKDSFSAS